MEQTGARGRRKGDDGGQKGKDQRACMSDPWTWTMVWGLTVRAGSGLGRGGQRGKNGDSCNRIAAIINIFILKKHID